MRKVNEWIKTHITTIIFWMLILGPVFDCVTSLSIHLLHVQLTLIMFLKILFLGILIYDLFFISKCRYKRKISLIILSILVYMMMYVILIILTKGPEVFLYECQSMLRTFFFPIVLLTLYNLYLEKRLKVNQNYLYIILVTYITCIFIPILTHTGFDSYAYSKVGTIGWFYSSNEIGGILSILFPFLFYYLLAQKKWWSILSIVIIMSVYFAIGTKVPILSMGITFAIFSIAYIMQLFQKKKWKQLSRFGILIILGVLSLLLVLPKTSFYKNIQIHLDFLKIDSMADLFTLDHIDHFIFSERIRFMKTTEQNYINASLSEKLLGIGYIENYATDQVNTKMVEMDYYDIFFRHGIVGSIIYFIPFLWILIKVVKSLLKNTSIPHITSVILILLLALFSGHIITAPSVSILVAYVLISCLEGEYE